MRFGKSSRGTLIAVAGLLPIEALESRVLMADITSAYSWQPVDLGAGGWVTGFATSPLDTNVRYCRTDVGNAYRWDATQLKWLPMKVFSYDGTTPSGVPGNTASAPSPGGVVSVAVDPTHVNTVYLAFTAGHSSDIGGSSGVNVYKSTDGGKNFTAGNLNVSGDSNDSWRMHGERLMVDPNNSKVIYFGTPMVPYSSPAVANGMYRSTDGGATWSQVTTGNGPGTTANVINVRFDRNGGVTTNNPFGGVVGNVSKIVVATVAGGDVYRSADGGATWTDISTGTNLANAGSDTTIDQTGNLWVVRSGTSEIWKYSGSSWTSYNTGLGLENIAVDPNNASRIFAIGGDASAARSLDGGKTWKSLGAIGYANTLGWLPQQIPGWRSNGGIYFDKAGALWLVQGNEGVLTYTPKADNSDTSMKWTIVSQGVEELVAHDVVIPKGSGDRAVVAVEDATGLVVTNPDTFTAKQIPLQTQLISNGTGVAACPNDPNYLVISSSDINGTNWQSPYNNFSGYSTDGGVTWHRFGSIPTFADGSGGQKAEQCGSLAVSVRGAWRTGQDHIVMVPSYSRQPYYSKDGGNTWTLCNIPWSGGWDGYWSFSLKQRQLYADPFVPDRFYFKKTGPNELYVSSDGGANWALQSSGQLPGNTHHGQLAVNYSVRNDLWFCDGWEGATSHGLWHSTDGGVTFTKVSGISNAITLTLGAGSGKTGDAAYTAYFYGKLSTDPNWGVFRSTDGGSSWDRIAYYPYGIYDQPTCMAASWDTFGLVYIGTSGNSFAYGKALAPKVKASTVNDGSAQRSMVTEVSLQFDRPVSLDVSQLKLHTRSEQTAAGVTLEASNPSGDQMIYVVRFSGSVIGGSLADGTYRLIVPTTTARSLASQPLATRYIARFYRLFGDADGNRVVDGADLSMFRQSLDSAANYLWYFDYSAMGSVVDAGDYLQFRARVRRPLLR